MARLRRNVRIEDLAARVGVSRFTIAAIEAERTGVFVAACFGGLRAPGPDEPLRELADPGRDEEGKALESVRRPRRVRPRAGLDNDL